MFDINTELMDAMDRLGSMALSYLGGSGVMALFGNFPFLISQMELERISKNTSFEFEEIKRANNSKMYQSVGGSSEEDMMISGFILGYQDHLGAIKRLISMGKEKRPHRLIMGNGKIMGKFLILSVSEEQSMFLDDGRVVRTDFRFELKREF